MCSSYSGLVVHGLWPFFSVEILEYGDEESGWGSINKRSSLNLAVWWGKRHKHKEWNGKPGCETVFQSESQYSVSKQTNSLAFITCPIWLHGKEALHNQICAMLVCTLYSVRQTKFWRRPNNMLGRVMDCGGSVFQDPGHDVKSTLYCKHSTETTIMGFVLATSVRAHFAVSDLSFDQYVVSESVRWGNDAHWTCPLLNTY